MKLGNITFGPELNKFYVGFDEELRKMNDYVEGLAKNATAYPPYNILKTSDTDYLIELAVAGFSEKDISIELHEGQLCVKGDCGLGATETEYIHRGIANRPFSRFFKIDRDVKVEDATFHNGMLSIKLKRIIPDALKPQKIEVKTTAGKQFLTEQEETKVRRPYHYMKEV